MLTQIKHSGVIILIIAMLSWPHIAAANANKTADIRILIDVSGSMKKNDPNNLRQPALRLLTGLLPADSEAGVWTFGQYVNMLVTHGNVSKNWKELARNASHEINSHGLYTNIEDTLRDATWDWDKPDPERHRSIILLTDGLVDISRDSNTNQESRSRILNELLPRLQQSGVNIHTIALANEADENLLRQLSSATQGSFTKTTTAQELERVFLKMFESSAEAETLPLQNNTVQVDNSIREMTLLIFHKPNAAATRIIRPDGSTIDQQNNDDKINWHNENNYNLVTIQEPGMGTWVIDADMDPNNRAIVVTDLTLKTDKLPSNIAINDHHDIDIRLHENGQPIISKKLLHFIKVVATLYNQQGEQEQQWPLLDNGLRNDRTENDGVYTLALDKHFSQGRHELIIDVDGTTFSRQQRLHFEAFKYPVITAIDTSVDGIASLYISPISGLIDPDSMNVTVTIDNEKQPRSVSRQHKNEWLLELADLDANKRHTLIIDISGKRDNTEINTRLEPLFYGDEPAIETTSHTVNTALEAPHTGGDTAAGPTAENIHNETDIPDENSLGTNLLILIQVLLLNAIAAGLIFTVYKKYKTKLQPENPLEELTHE